MIPAALQGIIKNTPKSQIRPGSASRLQKHQASDSEKIDWKFIKEFLENWCGETHDDLCRVLIDARSSTKSNKWKLLYDSVISELMHAARIHNKHKPKLLKALVYSFFDFVIVESDEYDLDFNTKDCEATFTDSTYKEYMDAYKEMYGSENYAGYLQTPTFKKIVEYIGEAYYTLARVANLFPPRTKVGLTLTCHPCPFCITASSAL